MRIGGLSPADVAGAAVLIAHPPHRGNNPKGWVFVHDDNWQQAALAAQFAAQPVGAGILPAKADFLPTASLDVITRLRVAGFPQSKGVQALLLDRAGQDVIAALSNQHLRPTQITSRSPDVLAGQLVPYRGGWARAYSDSIVLVSSEQRDYALAAAAWSAYSGDTLAFVTRDRLPAATRRLIVQRQKLRLQKPTVYLVGPDSVISRSVESQLRGLATVRRVAGRSASETAVSLARNQDAATGFGWGLSQAPASVALVNPRDWNNAFAAFDIAGAGPRAPLLLTKPDGSLPAEVVSYLQSLRGSQSSQAFVLGSASSIPTASLRQLDPLLDAGSAAATAPAPGK